MHNAPPRSHEVPRLTPTPVACKTGSIPVSNDRAPTGSEITAESHPYRSRVPRYTTEKGCRTGDQCPSPHLDAGQSQPRLLAATSGQPPSEISPARPVPPVIRDLPPRRHDNISGQRPVVAKPIPEAQKVNPRDFQILQIVRRYSPRQQDGENVTSLEFKLVPSDPDFPFELDGLQCELTVPQSWPADGKPKLRVKNNEIPKGYRVNIERGFDGLVSSGRTLLALMNELDKNLERFLTSEKAQTVKFVANAPKSESGALGGSQSTFPELGVQPPATVPTFSTPPIYSIDQRREARSKRDGDVRQLEARMNRAALFGKSADGISFNVPIQVIKAGRLPLNLRELKEVTLSVPLLYNLEPCSVKLKDVAGNEAHNVETAFEKRARQEPDQTLMAHVNYLTQHMHSMANSPVAQSAPVSSTLEPKLIQMSKVVTDVAADLPDPSLNHSFDVERPHIKVVPRPPEWDLPAGESDVDSSNTDDSEDDLSGSEDAEDPQDDGGAALPSAATGMTATGNSIVISFPGIELYGIELLEIVSLALTLKCDRCKSTVDIKSLRSNAAHNATSVTVTESCPKCATSLAATYSGEPMHANSIKAGHLDLTSCTIADMLPSTFTPTCSACSTAYPVPPGVISVRGETTLAVCRRCHRKMTFKIYEVKFLRIASHASGIPLPPRKGKVKENLGIVAGTPLPNTGRCSHYRKSHRWFRFSCCSKVFPCDRCHDENSEPLHPNEHANRMICGYCSREQNYRPEDCSVCGRSLIGRRGGGFWEGGKGTRDKLRMSRKDPRKYKRRGGQAPGRA